jgi:hypothetical protein
LGKEKICHVVGQVILLCFPIGALTGHVRIAAAQEFSQVGRFDNGLCSNFSDVFRALDWKQPSGASTWLVQ